MTDWAQAAIRRLCFSSVEPLSITIGCDYWKRAQPSHFSPRKRGDFGQSQEGSRAYVHPLAWEKTMATQVKPIPEGYHTLTPYLVVDGAEKIIRFMKDAFGAQPVFEPMMRPDGKVMHAEYRIGDSVVMISDSSERAQATSAMLHLYVPNVDATYQKALKAGATSLMEPADMFYGDRSGGVKDAAGNRWHIGTHIEDVSPAELKRRATEFMKQQHKAA
jgi:PhnB protein